MSPHLQAEIRTLLYINRITNNPIPNWWQTGKMREWDLKTAHPRCHGKSKLDLWYSWSHSSFYLVREVKASGCTELTGNQIPITGKNGPVSHGEVWRTLCRMSPGYLWGWSLWLQLPKNNSICGGQDTGSRGRYSSLNSTSTDSQLCDLGHVTLPLWAKVSTSMRWSSCYLCHRRSYEK